MALSHVFSGARAIFSIGPEGSKGLPVAFAQSVSGEESIEYTPVEVLDVIEVREFVPVAYRASLNCAIFRTIGRSMKALKIFPKALQSDILTSGDLMCTVVDDNANGGTGHTLYKYEQCKATTTNFDLSARGVVSENVSFVAIRRKDEFELEGFAVA